MKKVFLLLLFPFLMAFQCEDDFVDSGFETYYSIENSTDTDLFLIDDSNQITEIAKQSSITIGSTLNTETISVMPSESLLFESIKIYSSENDDFFLRYEQNPIDDESWILNEPMENAFEYTLIITDQLLD
ncbi:hypothetical protein [Flagellimonas profundi]|uniref:DUF1735 domain-containing protein n=1 Tax=Flagellimonas profundi TaxID=2915620 RepID=A0ABS3FDE2_9FLAO|nr:hypothetical protein [Allomuricauda profundi]MBO0340957.1 hypothetical protein [Allomuricauda profundi]